MKTLSHLLLILLLPTCALAQDYKRTWNWYFGDSLGLNFATDPPTVLTGSIGKTEGTSSISDTNGQLLFYTNGVTIWNRNHQIMQNGTGLNGHISSTQAALIVPQPVNDSLFYIFTTDAVGQAKGLQYSIVNINANGGLGAVITKNVLLQTPVCEKLAATKHQNGKDFWVVSHGFGNSTFFAYLLTEYGLIKCPVISNIGSIHSTSSVNNAQGQMKFSVDGKKIAVTVFDFDNSKIDLFNFNNATGRLNNYIPVTNIFLPFGIEFSNSTNHLYTTTRGNELITYKVDKLNSIEIESSKVVLIDYPNTGWIMPNLQIASNNRIYIQHTDSFHFGVINTPDSGGAMSGYSAFDVSTGMKRLRYGLPNFISSYFYRPTLEFRYTFLCNEPKANFVAYGDSPLASVNWNFKNISKGTSTTFSSLAVEYTFPDTGFYEISVTTNNDTVVKTIFIDSSILPKTDTLGCSVDSVVLNVPSSYLCLQWGDTSLQLYTRTIKSNGVYTIQGYNSQGCLITDSIRINFTPSPSQPVITKVNDSLYSSPAFNYQWFLNDSTISNASTQSIKPLKAGMYKVLITDSNGCSNVSTPYSSNVGTNELSSNDIKVYPNPATTTLTIEFNNTVCDLSITDVTGRSVYDQSSIINSPLQINCKSFHKGIYFIHIKNLNNTYRKKLIIQ